MVVKRRPTAENAGEAVRGLLGAVETGADIFDALDEIRLLHPKNNTFPGEVFMRLAADWPACAGSYGMVTPTGRAGSPAVLVMHATKKRLDRVKIIPAHSLEMRVPGWGTGTPPAARPSRARGTAQSPAVSSATISAAGIRRCT